MTHDPGVLRRGNASLRLSFVMPGLVPGIHVLAPVKKDVDGRAQASESDAVLRTAMARP
jgi:hypothetical protein